MGQVIIDNIWACLGLYFFEPGEGLQLVGAEATEWQALSSKKYAIISSGGINIGYAGSLESWIGFRDGGFGEDRSYCMETEMGK